MSEWLNLLCFPAPHLNQQRLQQHDETDDQKSPENQLKNTTEHQALVGPPLTTQASTRPVNQQPAHKFHLCGNCVIPILHVIRATNTTLDQPLNKNCHCKACSMWRQPTRQDGVNGARAETAAVGNCHNPTTACASSHPIPLPDRNMHTSG
jgi:hypothetical protein